MTKSFEGSSSSSEEYVAAMSIFRFLLITFIALGLLFLIINLIVRGVQSRRLRSKYDRTPDYCFKKNRQQNVELGLAANRHPDDILESTETDFRPLTAEDNQRFQRLAEDYAV